MNLEFFKRSPEEQAVFFNETAARRGVLATMVEKDFWVSWTLAVLFGHPEFSPQLVFKGGTSLSKVFAVIERFSEDIDLSVSPEFVGIKEEWVQEAGSRNKRAERMQELEWRCTERVRDAFLPELERIATEALGKRARGESWMEFEIDAATNSPVVLFHYPSAFPTGFDYLRRFVKMEFGSLTDQRPVGTHAIQPWVAEIASDAFADFCCEVVTLEIERTFWEKATILHAEYHRDPAKPIRDRLSRHYSDMAALARHKEARRALDRKDLMERVADWKSRFFAANWSRYDLAKPGTFRLAPAQERLQELQRDYTAMRDMFLQSPPPFEQVVDTLRGLEKEINETHSR